MSLRWSVVLVLAVVFCLFLAITQFVQRCIIMPSFTSLERQEAVNDINRCIGAIEAETQHLGALCGDWAGREDVNEFVQNRDPRFIEANLSGPVLASHQLNLLYICDTEGRVVWGAAHELPWLKPLALAYFAGPAIDPASVLLRHEKYDSMVRGILLTERGPMLVCSRPIVAGGQKGPIRGTVILGRFLNETMVQELLRRTRVSARLWPLRGVVLPAYDREVAEHLQSRACGPVVFRERSASVLSVYTAVPDVNNAPALLLRADIPRDVVARGRAALWFATLSGLVAAGFVMLLTWAVLRRLVVGPLVKLTKHATMVGRHDDLTTRFPVASKNEIGALADAFNRMVDRLAESRAKLLESAHRAGMAETASAVLHDVGNALNTVTVSAGLLDETVRESKVADLGEVVRLLREPKGTCAAGLDEGARGEVLVEYLGRLSASLAEEQQQIMAAARSIQEKVQHVERIIASQQSIAHGPAFEQKVDPVAVIEDALRVHRELMERHSIDIHREFDRLPPMAVNTYRLRRVIDNLIGNAIDAVLGAKESDRRLTVRAASDGNGWICIEVRDTGIGIEAADLDRVFQHGFTTKSSGHGFGLHFCANAVAEMGGTIRAASDGPGRGATFTVRLPVRGVGTET